MKNLTLFREPYALTKKSAEKNKGQQSVCCLCSVLYAPVSEATLSRYYDTIAQLYYTLLASII